MTLESTGKASTSLYPELDEAALAQIVAALESGETSTLAPARADEVTQARARIQFTRVRVPGAEDTELAGALWKQTGGMPSPAVVMPAPWTDLGWLAYAAQATQFALKGYHVLAYTPRGFGQSGGEVEVGGPLDVRDGSAAIDFLLEHTAGTVSEVGFLGDSYGSGISQLVAAHDSRVKAVAALSTWGSLTEAFYENDTRHVASVAALLGAAQNARLSEQTQRVFDQVRDNENIPDGIQEWSAERSPLVHVGKLNERNVPVFFSHAWHETLFPVNQTLKTFNALSGPKRIDLSIGDHSSPEMSGILGLPNRIWRDAHRFLDHHLKGEDNGIDSEGQVLSEIMWSKTQESLPAWEEVTGSSERLYLTGAAPGATDGGLTDKPQNGWSTVLLTGTDTPATVADAIIKTGYAEMAGNPKVYPTAAISRTDAGVWAGAPLTRVARVRGIPRLRLTCEPSTGDATFVAYLFDVDDTGNASIITHAPFTVLRATPGEPVVADVELQATGYDVPAGHRLMLVLDTKDPFYGDANEAGGKLTISSPDGDPSYLDLPLA